MSSTSHVNAATPLGSPPPLPESPDANHQIENMRTGKMPTNTSIFGWGTKLRLLPITLRGLVLLAFAVFLVLAPARLESDMVAAVVGYSLLLLTIGSLLVTTLQYLSLRSRVVPHISADSISSNVDSPTAGLLTRIVTNLSALRVLPLSRLEVELDFETPLRMTKHIISGNHPRGCRLIEDITFPHRGEWRLQHAALSIGDSLGLSVRRWVEEQSAHQLVVRVRPDPKASRQIPVVSSAVRSGDAISDIVERQGDLFDLKAYQPSDGIRRILWKVFAKRGELITRYPERAVSPEGQVVCFVIANEQEDVVCSEAIAYVRTLKDLDLEVWVGCEGQGNREIARSETDTENLLIESVWDTIRPAQASNSGTRLAAEIPSFLGQVRTGLGHSRLERLVVLVAMGRLGIRDSSHEIETVLSKIAANGITPLIIPIESEQAPANEKKGQRLLPGLLFEQESRGSQFDPAVAKQFLSVCAQRGWDVIM